MANSANPERRSAPESIGLPARPFLYTLDQIATLLDVSSQGLERYLFFERRSIGVPDRHIMHARNIAPHNQQPDWRVAENELLRWMRVKGFRYHEVGRLRS